MKRFVTSMCKATFKALFAITLMFSPLCAMVGPVALLVTTSDNAEPRLLTTEDLNRLQSQFLTTQAEATQTGEFAQLILSLGDFGIDSRTLDTLLQLAYVVPSTSAISSYTGVVPSASAVFYTGADIVNLIMAVDILVIPRSHIIFFIIKKALLTLSDEEFCSTYNSVKEMFPAFVWCFFEKDAIQKRMPWILSREISWIWPAISSLSLADQTIIIQFGHIIKTWRYEDDKWIDKDVPNVNNNYAGYGDHLLSKNGKTLVAIFPDNGYQVWQYVESGWAVQELPSLTNVSEIEISDNGNVIYGAMDQGIKAWRFNGLEWQLHHIDFSSFGHGTRLIIRCSEDGDTFALNVPDHRLIVFKYLGGAWRPIFSPNDNIDSICYMAKDGSVVVAPLSNGDIKSWHYNGIHWVSELLAENFIGLRSGALSEDGTTYIVDDEQRRLYVWRHNGRAWQQQNIPEMDQASSFQVSANGKTVFVQSHSYHQAGKAWRYDGQEWKMLSGIQGFESVAINNGTVVASSSRWPVACCMLYKIFGHFREDLLLEEHVPDFTGDFHQLRVSPNGRIILGQDNLLNPSLKIWQQKEVPDAVRPQQKQRLPKWLGIKSCSIQ